MLGLIKTVHTLIWFLMAAATIYILYAGLTNTTSIWLWLAIGLMLAEIVILLVYKMTCPLTLAAKKYKKNYNEGEDIYLPKWFAKYNKIIFGTILAIGLLLTLKNLLE